MTSTTPPIRTIDAHYAGQPGIAGCYLLRDGDRAAFVETCTATAVPRLLEALREEGLAPGQVEWVIVTHAHLDHAGGAGALLRHLPSATLVAHPRAAPHLVDPSRLRESATAVYGEERMREWYGELVPVPERRVRVVAEGEVVALGERPLRVLHTPGHANHHLCLHDPRAEAVFTGDAFGVAYPALQRRGPLAFPSSSPTDFDAAQALETVDRLVATGARRVFPTHLGEHREVEALADQLRRQLRHLGDAVDRAEESGLDGAELDAWTRRVAAEALLAELAARGLDTEPELRALVALDAELNGQGLAFAVRKRRFKRARGG